MAQQKFARGDSSCEGLSLPHLETLLLEWREPRLVSHASLLLLAQRLERARFDESEAEGEEGLEGVGGLKKQEKFDSTDLFNLVCAKNSAFRESPFHVSNSCFLFDASGQKMALVDHKKAGEWLYPGGHADGNWNWLGNTVKECVEESGVKDLVLCFEDEDVVKNETGDFEFFLPAFLTIHPIKERANEAAHFHLDSVFLFQTQTDALKFCVNESRNVRWFTADVLAAGRHHEPRISRKTEKLAGLAARRFVLAHRRLKVYPDEST